MLETFTVGTFLPHVGDVFRLSLGRDGTLELRLADAAEVRPTDGATGRSQFSIVFRGPADPVLPQGIYAFEHEELGGFELFIVPIERDAAGTSYEAAFA